MKYGDAYTPQFLNGVNQLLGVTAIDKDEEIQDFIDVRQIIERVNYTVSEKDLGRLSGFVDANESIICINKSNSEGRKNFTLGHELAHILQNKTFAMRGEATEYSEEEKVDEVFANKFSAELIMPKNLIEHHLENVLSEKGLDKEKINTTDVDVVLSEIAKKMQVSNQALNIRVDRLNILTATQGF
ncbi:ImmA/IrrE family metallo-endopeptidase [Weissella ceti]|uniref:ImmA/IrrE family metallo-endopeptidase n=1 Tax=Weissella ceti TaxID=759620 RepID=A0ABT3E731_9LACO|nr:ImmA/IrrE family metallo-endopeptidase [Weissella ceti]MCW0953752.1 ImmA/IrrE family metallo-endopeptidase [Weissella ceti]QVK11415.1 ImmA/IrrE family metallo-endopeptidase [Weissella ceti]